MQVNVQLLRVKLHEDSKWWNQLILVFTNGILMDKQNTYHLLHKNRDGSMMLFLITLQIQTLLVTNFKK